VDWDWYKTIAVLAFTISAATAWEVARLRKHVHIEDWTPTRKWNKAISGPKHVPSHKQDQVSEAADEDACRFYRDFSHVADLLNLWHEDSPWSFENTGKLENQYGELGAEREIEIRYNQQKTGTIKLTCIHYGHESFGEIRAQLDLISGRFFEGFDVVGLATSLASIVDGTEEAIREAKTGMMMAMINAMWEVGEEAFGNPSLEFVTQGKAEWYLNDWLPKNAPPLR
jgi:hypothetical protein